MAQALDFARMGQLGALLHLVDPTLPIGGFNHSNGLETFVQQGKVNSKASLEEYVYTQLDQNWIYNDGAYLSLAFDAMQAKDFHKNGVPRIKKFADEHKGKKIQDIWTFKDPMYPTYPTEKNADMLDLIIAQSSNQDSIVMDCFAGSGSTLKSAERLGRKWIGVDISPVSLDVIVKNLENTNFQIVELG